MKNFALAVAFRFLSLKGVAAFACAGERVTLNDNTVLMASGIYNNKEGKLDIDLDAFEARIKSRNSVTANATSSENKITHRVEYLGSVREVVKDAKGVETLEVIQSSYLVRDLKTNEEKVYVLRSNYLGNGVWARGVPGPEMPTKADQRFQSLFRAQCG